MKNILYLQIHDSLIRNLSTNINNLLHFSFYLSSALGSFSFPSLAPSFFICLNCIFSSSLRPISLKRFMRISLNITMESVSDSSKLTHIYTLKQEGLLGFDEMYLKPLIFSLPLKLAPKIKKVSFS